MIIELIFNRGFDGRHSEENCEGISDSLNTRLGFDIERRAALKKEPRTADFSWDFGTGVTAQMELRNKKHKHLLGSTAAKIPELVGEKFNGFKVTGYVIKSDN